jgi:hypothetical protein
LRPLNVFLGDWWPLTHAFVYWTATSTTPFLNPTSLSRSLSPSMYLHYCAPIFPSIVLLLFPSLVTEVYWSRSTNLVRILFIKKTGAELKRAHIFAKMRESDRHKDNLKVSTYLNFPVVYLCRWKQKAHKRVYTGFTSSGAVCWLNKQYFILFPRDVSATIKYKKRRYCAQSLDSSICAYKISSLDALNALCFLIRHAR